MSTEVIIALIGVASTIISWLLGRGKTKADIASMQLEYIKSSDEFYRERITNLQKEVAKQSLQIRSLRIILDRIIDDACLIKQCPKREYYTQETLQELARIENLDLDIIDPNSIRSDGTEHEFEE